MFGRDELESLPGRAFPGGWFLITAEQDATMREVVGAPPGDGSLAHPIWMFAGPQGAMGITIDDLFGWCGSSASDGPMLGETRLAMPRPLRVGRRYDVTGGIVAAARKQGRRAGVFDIVTFELNLASADPADADADADPAWQARTSFVFPRRS